MKLLQINKFFRPIGGPETIMFDTMRELEALGHTVIPFAMAHPENAESGYSEYFVPGVDYNSSSKGVKRLVRESIDLVYSVEAKRRIEKLISKVNPDIAHAHNIYHQLSPSILKALKKEGIPTLLTFHDYKPLCANMNFLTHGQICEKCQGRRFHHAVVNRCVKDSLTNSMLCFFEETLHRWLGIYERNVDLFISPSHFLKQKLVEYRRLPEEQITVLHNYANTKQITPDYNPGDYGLFIGKLESFKGVGTLLKACEQNRDFPLYLAGKGPMLEEGQEIAERQKLDKLKFLGFQTGQTLVKLLRESRFVVVPSEWYENCPMVILEAFAAGKPVIASGIGGIPELVEHGSDGLLFEPGDVEGLASHMRQLINDPQMASEMGRNARVKVEQRYSIEHYIESLLGIYHKVRND